MTGSWTAATERRKARSPRSALAPLAAGRNAMPPAPLRHVVAGSLISRGFPTPPSPLMHTRLAVVAPLMLAAVLQAQEPPAGQGPTPQQQLEKLKAEKQRLQREIEFAKKRAQQASGLLSNKFRRGAPKFRSIDAGKPNGMLSTMPKPVKRKPARIGTPEEMKVGGGDAMVVVNRRGIGDKVFNDVSEYLMSYNPQARPDLVANRVLYDLIRIEGVVGSFVDNQAKVYLAEALDKLQAGSMSFADAAKNYGTVQGADESGKLTVTRNSVQGPFFEFMAFSTAAGQVSRPFATPKGYAVVKVEELVKGKTASLDQLKCSVALFKFSNDEAEMTEAQYAVTSGQADVLVRDQSVMAKLPALYRAQTAPASRPAGPTQAARIATMKAQLQKLVSAGEGQGAEAKKLRAQIQAMSQRARAQGSDADIKAKPPQDSDRKDFDSKQIKRATKPAKPAGRQGGGN